MGLFGLLQQFSVFIVNAGHALTFAPGVGFLLAVYRFPVQLAILFETRF
jgi:hypothetical protein